MTSFYLCYLFKGLISIYSHILRYWGLGLQLQIFGGHDSALNSPVV